MINNSWLITFLVWAIPGIFAITLHEVAHGRIALRLGDPTAKQLRRLSLNPLRHISLVGTLLIPGLLIVANSPFVFGWAKPVPVDPRYFNKPRRDMALVALAGPLANLGMAILWAICLKFVLTHPYIFASNALYRMASIGVQINLLLMCFNLLPIPPLDGSKVVAAFLPTRVMHLWYRFENIGWLVLFALVFSGIFSIILGPMLATSQHLLLKLI